jgi:hypothetical protein
VKLRTASFSASAAPTHQTLSCSYSSLSSQSYLSVLIHRFLNITCSSDSVGTGQERTLSLTNINPPSKALYTNRPLKQSHHVYSLHKNYIASEDGTKIKEVQDDPSCLAPGPCPDNGILYIGF